MPLRPDRCGIKAKLIGKPSVSSPSRVNGSHHRPRPIAFEMNSVVRGLNDLRELPAILRCRPRGRDALDGTVNESAAFFRLVPLGEVSDTGVLQQWQSASGEHEHRPGTVLWGLRRGGYRGSAATSGWFTPLGLLPPKPTERDQLTLVYLGVRVGGGVFSG